jgi:hypothetical protein
MSIHEIMHNAMLGAFDYQRRNPAFQQAIHRDDEGQVWEKLVCDAGGKEIVIAARYALHEAPALSITIDGHEVMVCAHGHLHYEEIIDLVTIAAFITPFIDHDDIVDIRDHSEAIVETMKIMHEAHADLKKSPPKPKSKSVV